MTGKKYSTHKLMLSIAMLTCFFGALFSRVIFDYALFLVFLFMLFFTFKKVEGLTWKNLFLPTGFGWVWPLWVFSVALSLVVNGLYELGNLTDVLNFRWMIGMFFLARAFLLVNPTKRIIEIVLVVVGAICLGFVVTLGLQPSGSFNLDFSSRLMGAYRNPNDYAHAYLLIGCFGIAYFFVERSQSVLRRESLRWSLLIICFSIFLTYSRTAWFSLIVVFLAVLLVVERKSFLKYFFFVALSLGAAYSYNIANLQVRTDYTFETQAGSLKDGRINLWRANWKMFHDHMVFGVGYNNNTAPLPAYYEKLGIKEGTLISHAHNQYLQYLSTTGIFGLGCYLLVFCNIFYHGIKRLSQPNDGSKKFLLLPTLFSLVGFLLGGLADNNFDIYTAQPFVIILFAFCIYLNFNSSSIPSKSEDVRRGGASCH